MMRQGHLGVLVATLATVLSITMTDAAEKIGTAAIIENSVTGTLEGTTTAAPLARGDSLYANQRIDTSADSRAQLLFADQSALTMSPNSSVVLDKFVYDPKPNVGSVVINTVTGAFRFVGGTADKTAGSGYEVKTPVGTIGIRGTMFEWEVTDKQLSAVLTEGAIDVCLTNQNCVSLNQPGTYVLTRGERVSGIQRWTGKGGEAEKVAHRPSFDYMQQQQVTAQPPQLPQRPRCQEDPSRFC